MARCSVDDSPNHAQRTRGKYRSWIRYTSSSSREQNNPGSPIAVARARAVSLGNSEANDVDVDGTRGRRGEMRPGRREGAGHARLHLHRVSAPKVWKADSRDEEYDAWPRSGVPVGRPRGGDGRGEGDERRGLAGGGGRGPGRRQGRARGEGRLPPLRRRDRALVPEGPPNGC